MHEVPILYLLSRQKERQRLEHRSMAAILAASLFSGMLMAGLSGSPWVAIPWSAGPACLLFWLLRAIGDAGSLYQLMIGGAWREIRLSRIQASQVVDGITLQGLKTQLPWTVGAGLALAAVAPTWVLPWLAAVLLGSVVASFYGQLSVVQRHVSRPPLAYPTNLRLAMSFSLLVILAWSLPLAWLLVPGVLWLTMLLRACAFCSLDAIPEGHLLASDQSRPGRRALQWQPWSDNPIVARETARESFRLGSNWFSALNHFAGWGALLAFLPAVYAAMWATPNPSFGAVTAFYLMLYVLFCGLLQAGRAGHRVFRALSEERDRQTLDLLVVTSLQPADFVDGWAEVGWVSRHLEMALITLVALVTGWSMHAGSLELALIAYAGLLGLVVISAGSYMGLLLGFRNCMRRKRKRDWVFPALVLAWGLATASMLPTGLPYLLLQGLAAAAVIALARWQALRALHG